jgi:FAD/FMN-containing dehydrogenase
MQNGNLQLHLEEKEKKEGGKKEKPKITPIDCDILLDLSPMNKVLQVDQASKQATVESGITIANLQSELQRHGFSLECLP